MSYPRWIDEITQASNDDDALIGSVPSTSLTLIPGQFLVAAIEWRTDPGSVTPDLSDWTLIESTNNGTLYLHTYYRYVGAGDPANYEFAWSNPAAWQLSVHQYEGVHPTAPIAVVAEDSSTSDTATSPSLSGSPVFASQGLFVVLASDGHNEHDPTDGLTERWDGPINTGDINNNMALFVGAQNHLGGDTGTRSIDISKTTGAPPGPEPPPWIVQSILINPGPTARSSKQFSETITFDPTETVRSTKQFSEALLHTDPEEVTARSTKQFIEVLVFNHSAKETQEYLEAVFKGEPGAREVQEYLEAVFKGEPGAREVQEYLEAVFANEPGAREVQEYLEAVFYHGPSTKAMHQYVEVVSLVGYVPPDVAGAQAWMPLPSAIGMGRGLTGDPEDPGSPATIAEVTPGAKIGLSSSEACEASFVLFESTVSNDAKARVYRILQVSGGWTPEDDPTILMTQKNGYDWSRDGRFLAVAASASVLPTTPHLAFYRTDTWEIFAGPLDVKDPYAPVWNNSTSLIGVGGKVGDEERFRIYAVPGWSVVKTLPAGAGGAFSPDDSLFAFMSRSAAEIEIYETSGWTLVETIDLNHLSTEDDPWFPPYATSVDWHPSGNYLAATYAVGGRNHYGSFVAVGDWMFWDTSDWSELTGFPSARGTPGYGGLGGGPTETKLVRFSPKGNEVSYGQERGYFNSARAAIYTFPDFDFVLVVSGAEGSASKNTFDYNFNGALWTVASGSLDFPSHTTRVRDGSSLFANIGAGHRGGRVFYGPGVLCIDGEGWGTVFF